MEDERIDGINEHLRLIQKPGGLAFGTDAYLLYAYLPAGKAFSRMADLGGGTGVLSLLCLASDKVQKAVCVEIQPEFADLIGRNAALNGLSDRLIPLCKDVRELSAADIGGFCDAVLTNPPYLSAECGYHNENPAMDTARREIHGTVADFCAAAARILRDFGRFLAVYRPDRLPDLLISMRQAGIEPKRLTAVHPSAGKPPSLILCEGRKGGAPGLFYTKPLILHTPDGGMSEELRQIYERGSFDESYRIP